MLQLSLHHRTTHPSSLAGLLQEFDQRVVRVGRGHENDVKFDAQRDRSVSGSHAEIRVSSTGLEIEDLGSRNGTFVNGARIDRISALGPGDIVRLGADGPEFEVQFDDPDVAPMTLEDVGGAPQTIVAEEPSTSEPGGVPAIRPFGGGAPVAPAPPPGRAPGVPAVPAVPAAPSPGGPPPQAGVPPHPMAQGGAGGAPPVPAHPMARRGQEDSPGSATSSEPRQSVGMNTLMNVVQGAVSSERRRIMRLVVPLAVVLVGVVGALVWWPRSAEASWDEILDSKVKSVYVCIHAQDLGGDKPYLQPFGTAWAVAPGMLATNAHVAEQWEELSDGDEFLVRDNSSTPVDLRIERVEYHPGYEMFREFRARYLPAAASMPDAFDVALLHVSEEDADKLNPPLELASNSNAQDLKAGQKICMIGFPMEDQAKDGIDRDRPEPRMIPGFVTRMADVFFANAEPEDCLSLACSLQSAGGASGSPLFNSAGEVVGLNSAGDYKFVGSERFGSGGAYGQRVDILRELIDGVADEMMHGRSGALEERFLNEFRNSVATPFVFAVEHLDDFVNDPDVKDGLREDGMEGEYSLAHECVLEVQSSGRGGAAQCDSAFTAPVSGLYVYYVVPLDAPMSPQVAIRIGRTPRTDLDVPEEHFWWDLELLTAGTDVEISVRSPDDITDFDPTRYSVIWFLLQ